MEKINLGSSNILKQSVSREELNNVFATVINGIMLLTNRELELLTFLMKVDQQWNVTKDGPKNIISTEKRKIIMEALKLAPYNLSRYLTKFKEKGIVVKGRREDEWMLNPIVLPLVIGDRVQLTVVLRVKKDEKEGV